MKKITKRRLEEMYSRMRAHFGHLGWWQGESPFEVMAGAILTQNTAWTNVEKAIRNLKNARVLDARILFKMSDARLGRLIRPAGYYNVKTRRLKSFLRYLHENYYFDISAMRARKLPVLRKELLGVSGIGEETADSMLLYALEKPTFVVDAYTRRILSRHGMIRGDESYEEIKGIFEKYLEKKRGLFKDFHAQIVYTAKEFCRKKPLCNKCPLYSFLPRKAHMVKKKFNI